MSLSKAAAQAINDVVARDGDARARITSTFSMFPHWIQFSGPLRNAMMIDRDWLAQTWHEKRPLWPSDVNISRETQKYVCTAISDAAVAAIGRALALSRPFQPGNGASVMSASSKGATASFGSPLHSRPAIPTNVATFQQKQVPGGANMLEAALAQVLAVKAGCSIATDHYAPDVEMTDHCHYVFDWWMTLNVNNPIIWKLEDWQKWPNPSVIRRGIPLCWFQGFA